MKKIAYVESKFIMMHDSTDYIKIEKDGQHIDDNYVDYNGDKINSYSDTLQKGEIIIKQLYYIGFEFPHYNYYAIKFRNFRYYSPYNTDESNKVNRNLDTKNSVFDYDSFGDFNYVKEIIVNIFLGRMETDIE